MTNSEIFKKSVYESLDNQVGGKHYTDYKIQPIEFITSNNIGFIEGNVIKYVTRFRQKNGIEDIDKAIHYLELLKEMYYNGKT